MSINTIKEKLKWLVAAFLHGVVKAIDILKIIVCTVKQYLRENKHVQNFLKIWKDFWEYKKQHPGQWMDSPQDKALRTAFGVILRIVYVSIFIWGVVVVEQKRQYESDPVRILNSTVSPNPIVPREPAQHVKMNGKTYEIIDTGSSTANTLQDIQRDNSPAPTSQQAQSNSENQMPTQQGSTNNVSSADSTASTMPPVAPPIRKTLEEEEMKDSISRYSKTLPEANLPVTSDVNAPTSPYVERTGGAVQALGSEH